ncbi:MAG: ATP-binding cassette domain-containing protein, partial [Proteobacteria bacterium]
MISSADNGKWLLADFSTGSYREVSADRLHAELKHPGCLVVQKIENVFPPPKKEFHFLHLLRFLTPQPSLLVALVLGSCLGFLVDISVPVFTQYILDQVVSSGRVALLNPLMAAFAVLTVIGVLLTGFNQAMNNYLTNVLGLRMKAFFQKALFKLNPVVIQTMGASQLMSRIGDIDQVAAFLVNQCIGSCLGLLFMLGNLSVLWIYSPKLVALILCLLPIGIGLTLAMRGRIQVLKLDQVRTKVRENRLLLEHFSSTDDMRTLKGVLPSRWKWDFNSHLFAKNLRSNQKMQAVFQILQLVGSEGVKMAAFFFSLHQYMQSQMTLGQVMAVIMIVPRVTEPIQSIVSMLYHYYGNKLLITRLNDLLATKENVPGKVVNTGPIVPVAFDQSLRFESVSMQYEKASHRRVLRGIDFEIKHGERIAFMGNVGAGKSSLAYLMAGLYEPDEGKIFYDKIEKEQIDAGDFHSQVSLVEQEGRLFAGTILDNIALGQDQPDLERAVRCAKAVVMDDDILARPGGYSSVLMHGGVGLSEGQRQRILIARALYKDPQILILDESTSYLDPISDSLVVKNILELMKGRTVIFFSQRIQITAKVDRVFFMDKGELLEQGSHRELIANKRQYFN